MKQMDYLTNLTICLWVTGLMFGLFPNWKCTLQFWECVSLTLTWLTQNSLGFSFVTFELMWELKKANSRMAVSCRTASREVLQGSPGHGGITIWIWGKWSETNQEPKESVRKIRKRDKRGVFPRFSACWTLLHVPVQELPLQPEIGIKEAQAFVRTFARATQVHREDRRSEDLQKIFKRSSKDL